MSPGRFAAFTSTSLLGALLLLSPVAVVEAAEPAQNFDAFRLLRTRNIFDPERQATRSESAPRPQSTASRPNYLALTGTMVTASKSLAFFNGSRSEYSKVISVRDTIADYTVAGITAQEVELERAGNKVTVAVGRQLPLEGFAPASSDQGPLPPAPGSPGAGAAPVSSPGTAPASLPGAAPPAPGAPGAPPDKNELRRRMEERRQKEISK